MINHKLIKILDFLKTYLNVYFYTLARNNLNKKISNLLISYLNMFLGYGVMSSAFVYMHVFHSANNSNMKSWLFILGFTVVYIISFIHIFYTTTSFFYSLKKKRPYSLSVFMLLILVFYIMTFVGTLIPMFNV